MFSSGSTAERQTVDGNRMDPAGAKRHGYEIAHTKQEKITLALS